MSKDKVRSYEILPTENGYLIRENIGYGLETRIWVATTIEALQVLVGDLAEEAWVGEE